MSVTAYKSPGTAASVDRDGNAAWSNPDNAKTDNAAYASSDIWQSSYSDWLRLTNYGFTSADIPVGATIDGIEVSVQRKGEAADKIKDSAFYLRKTSGQTGNNKASATYWATTEETAVYGGASDMWGTALTQADIVSSDFGIDLSAANSGLALREAYIDVIQIRIYYTAGTAYEKTLTDSVSLSEAILKAPSRTLSDSIALSEVINKGTVRIFGDSVSLSEVFSKGVARVFSDAVALADAIIRGWEKVFSDTLALTDTISRDMTRTFADAVSLLEVVNKQISLFITDTITIAEDTIIKGVGKTFSETINLVDSITKTLFWLPKAFITATWVALSKAASAWQQKTNAVSSWIKKTKGANTWQKKNYGDNDWTTKTK